MFKGAGQGRLQNAVQTTYETFIPVMEYLALQLHRYTMMKSTLSGQTATRMQILSYTNKCKGLED
jgi:hypothetical protein